MSWLDALRPTFPMIQRNCSFLKHSQRVGNNQKYDFPVSKKKKNHTKVPSTRKSKLIDKINKYV